VAEEEGARRLPAACQGCTVPWRRRPAFAIGRPPETDVMFDVPLNKTAAIHKVVDMPSRGAS
jgi:hypothetical protein